MFKYKSRTERYAEAEKKKSMLARSALEKAIVDLAVISKDKDVVLTPALAVQHFQEARYRRHELWVEFLKSCSNQGAFFGDVRCADVIAKINNLYRTNLVAHPDIANLTPDIFLVNANHVVLGDVAVSRTAALVGSIKTQKYYPIRKYLQENGITVLTLNFIVKDDGSNLDSIIKEFSEVHELIRYDRDQISRARHFMEVCSNIMNHCMFQNTCPKEFRRLLDESDRVRLNIDTDIQLPDEITGMDFVNTEIIRSEDEIISMVKEELENNPEKYKFDNGIDDTMTAFDKLIDSYSDREEFIEPKATLKVVDNSNEIEMLTNHDLIRSYITDLMFSKYTIESEYIRSILPSLEQLKDMQKIYREKIKDVKSYRKENKVHGPYQYERINNPGNIMISDLNYKLQKGKKVKNEKEMPRCINPIIYDKCKEKIENMINYYGSLSEKKPFLNDSWEAKTNFESENTKVQREIYDYVRCTNGAQLCNSLSGLYHRLSHLRTRLSLVDNVYVPPNGSFIAVIPKNHAPISSRKCNLPMLFITRYKKTDNANDDHLEYDVKIHSDNYIYYVSKLCRIDIDKISNWEQSGYKMVASASYILTYCTGLLDSKEKVVGLLTVLSLDLHQKSSEFLDLLKYISFMPFANVSKLSSLVLDKMDLLIKTSLDVWLLLSLKDFMMRLSEKEKMNATKPKLKIFNTIINRDSLGLSLSIPSFIDSTVKHTKIEQFIEEISMVYIIRPKKLYGSQFLEKSITETCKWNNEYLAEQEKYGEWVTTGHEKTSYPFDAKFAYSRDAIIHAQNYFHDINPVSIGMVQRNLITSNFDIFMHKNCSLRGCTKDKKHRSNINDFHTTSMESCLTYYAENKYDDNKCRSTTIAINHLLSNEVQQYSQSEKEQRGAGRPISSPNLSTKAVLMMLEKPEQAIGRNIDNNIIVPGKNKLQEQSMCYKKLLSQGASEGYNKVYQLTEDQSKWSENDNSRKFECYISNNMYLNPNIRRLQLLAIRNMINREHLVHKIPDSVCNDPELSKYINNDRNGIKVIIGWPQGMLNCLSTSIHAIADKWIAYAYNKAYPNNKVLAMGLVHSDDSCVNIACNDEEDFVRFVKFRLIAKKLFCLKLNVKKLWGSDLLGEIVSNYNINGNVHLSISKVLANSFGNLIFVNWVIDVHNQISALQQAYRNGADLGTIVMLSTILKQQMLYAYQVKGKHLELIHHLPVEIGGYPGNSPFELAVTGLNCHYNKIRENYKIDPNDEPGTIINKLLSLSMKYRLRREAEDWNEGIYEWKSKTKLLEKYIDNEHNKIDMEFIDSIDYQNVVIPSRGEIFSCLSHIMPKSRKVAKTITMIENLPYETDGLELIITNPDTLSVSLGHLKSQSSTFMYQLAAEGYTMSARRLAVAQAIQSSGKIVRINKLLPMSFNELIELMLSSENIENIGTAIVDIALADDSEISDLCEAIVYKSESIPMGNDKRKIINKMPEIYDNFRTICRIQNVLLHMIDRSNKTRYLEKYGVSIEHVQLLNDDADLLKRRFSSYFSYYNTKEACNLIMQQYIGAQKSRLWMQPYLRSDDQQHFLQDLYGKTVSMEINYKILIDFGRDLKKQKEAAIVKTLYTVDVLNEIYPGKFKMNCYGKGDNIKSINDVLNDVDYGKLDDTDEVKYAVLQYKWNNKIDYLMNINEKNKYEQRYIVKQEFINGRYMGHFNILVKYNKTVIRIEGTASNVRLTVSNERIVDILNGMFCFVNKNFPAYKYKHPFMWGRSKFWENMTNIGNNFLVYHSNLVTMIQNSNALHRIPIEIDNNLSLGDGIPTEHIIDFSIENNMSVIYSINENNERMRLRSIPVGLQAPKIDYVGVDYDLIDGIPNNRLLETKLIINLTLNRNYNCSKSDIEAILEETGNAFDVKPIVHMFQNISLQLMKLDPITEIKNEMEVVEEMEIGGYEIINLVKDSDATSPSDLTFEDLDYGISDAEREGRIYKYVNVKDALCKVFNTNNRISDRDYIIQSILRDQIILAKMLQDAEQPREIIMQMINGALNSEKQIDKNVYCYIKSHGLDKPDGLPKGIVKKLLDPNLTVIPSSYSIQNMSQLIRQYVKTHIYKIEDEMPNLLEKAMKLAVNID